jgi:ABC-2 type transport system ATP-binding protein
VITADGLTKRYGTSVAVDDLSFTVEPGRVTGFLGPNGAGKSTTMRLMLALDRANAGTSTFNGVSYHDLRNPLREVGSLLDAGYLHPSRKARHHLWAIASSNRIPKARVDEVLAMVGLTEVADKRAGTFSLGMKQRLGLAGALLGDPGTLILDEPGNGLDPEGIRWIRGFLRSLAEEGRAVLVSSHLMSELEDTADHLLVIGRGRLIADTTVRDLLDTAAGLRFSVRTPQPVALMALLAEAGALVTSTDHEALTVAGLEAARIADLAADHGLRVYELSPHRVTLEDAFMNLTRESVDYTAGKAP